MVWIGRLVGNYQLSRGTFPILSRHPSFYKKTPKFLGTQLVFEKNDGCKEWNWNHQPLDIWVCLFCLCFVVLGVIFWVRKLTIPKRGRALPAHEAW